MQKPIHKITDLQELEKLHQQAQYRLSVARSLQNADKAIETINNEIKAIKKRKIDLK